MSHKLLQMHFLCILLLAAVSVLPACTNNKVADNIVNTINNMSSVTADFSYTVQSPSTLVFTNKSKDATHYAWDFGDGTTSTATSPTHTYTQTGYFSITLTATNKSGYSKSKTQTVLIENTKKISISMVTLSQYPTLNKYYYFQLLGPTDNVLYTSSHLLVATSGTTYALYSKAQGSPIPLDVVDSSTRFRFRLYRADTKTATGTLLVNGFTLGMLLFDHPAQQTYTGAGATLNIYFSYE